MVKDEIFQVIEALKSELAITQQFFKFINGYTKDSFNLIYQYIANRDDRPNKV
jgi:hypothetical protein